AVLPGGGSISTSNGVQGLCLYQQGSALAEATIIVDNVRVATDLASLFTEEPGGDDGDDDDDDDEDATPELTIVQQTDFIDEAAPINEDTRFATFTVEAKNLEAATSIWLGGKDRDQFSLSTEEIPAGTGSYEVVVTYHPTAIGKYSATVNFDATPTELSATYALAAAAYDPENLPTITVPESVEAFEAAPNEVDEKTVTISSANMFDYVYLAVEEATAPGVFVINQGMMLANDSYELKITFQPLQEGDYTAKVKVYSTMVDAQYLELKGHSDGTVPPEPQQGGELLLDKSNPLTLLVENFDNVEHNQPLALDGWDNVAMEGTRAWWGYTFSDDQEHGRAAKVTAYDSEAEYDTPCEMLLVTPALDFKNAASKVFTCSVMGQFLPSEGTEEVLEVLYIEDKDYMEPIQGLNIPCISDQNKEWVDYVIDFEGQPLADVFFIGFRLKSQRGHSNAKTYYVDNVSWGRTDIPQVKADTRLLEYTGVTTPEVVTSPDITVTGLNLTEDIKVKVYGPDAQYFEPSTTTLPATGGTFHLQSSFDVEGDYVAYVELSSEGAGPFLFEVHVSVSLWDSIGGVGAQSAVTEAYDLTGRKITGSAVKNLRRGIYVIDGKKIAK
ncbi:MAG: hypothetical protein HUK02_03985, partial [Bacteroidaceae bacterium]|nr:hypothetical protein [Bacteroidaceae bacterium]